MPFVVRCPACGQRLRVPSKRASRPFRCPQCQTELVPLRQVGGKLFVQAAASSDFEAEAPSFRASRSGAREEEIPFATAVEDEGAAEEILDAIPVPPPSAPSRLVPCRECGRQIAKSAAACPSCGGPNDWLHPRIRRFIKEVGKYKSPLGFTWEAKGYRIVLTAHRPQSLADAAADLVGSIGFLVPLSGAGLASLFLLELGKAGTEAALRSCREGNDQEVLIVDFGTSPPRWNSTNRRYWLRVLRFFDLA